MGACISVAAAPPKPSRKGLVSFYSLSAVKGDGDVQMMEDLRGKVVYAINVASR